MDSIFRIGDEAERAAFLRHMMQSFGSTYICLWSYSPLPSNCLLYFDGFYQEENNQQQPSSSSGSFARRLFNVYCGSVNYFDHGCVPGFAFKNNLPYMDMNLDYLQTLASSEVQLQFYQEAGIKTLVFMGCAAGEIELGFSSDPQANLEMEMKDWFPVDFSRQTYAEELPHDHLMTNQNLPPTSSSSLGSLSLDSNDYSPSLFNIPVSTSFITEPSREPLMEESHLQSDPMSEPISTSPHRQAIRALSKIRNIQLPTIESEDAAMTRAILAVLSSPSTSSCSQNMPPVIPRSCCHDGSAFKSYRAALAPVRARSTDHHEKQNLFRRAVLFFRNLNMRRTQELQIPGKGPTPGQLHHMIQERKRREKLNESFRVLKTLLPQLSKKDKASVLSITTEYLSSLKSQVEELRKRNHVLETQLSTTDHQRETGEELGFTNSSTERVNVEIEHVSPSTSGSARFLDLRVRLRSGECSLFDLVFRVMKFLKQQRNVRLLSVMQSNTQMVESTPVHGLVLRLKVEGNDFDVSGFQEAVRRVVGDLPNS